MKISQSSHYLYVKLKCIHIKLLHLILNKHWLMSNLYLDYLKSTIWIICLKCIVLHVPCGGQSPAIEAES